MMILRKGIPEAPEPWTLCALALTDGACFYGCGPLAKLGGAPIPALRQGSHKRPKMQ